MSGVETTRIGARIRRRWISLAVSPDADDQFMVRALLDGLIPTGKYGFRITSSPTDALNHIASGSHSVSSGPPAAVLEGPDVLAIGIAHYPLCADRYQLLPHGGSMGEGYGPVIVSGKTLPTLDGVRLAVPGLTTTAWLVTRLLLGPKVNPVPVVIPIAPHERVFEALEAGEVDAALLIHEGRLTFGDRGYKRVLELGEAWAARHGGLPLPLGGNVIRRDLGEDTIREVSDLLRQSIAHGLQHLDDAVKWLLARGGPLKTADRVERYLSMYANFRTLDYGHEGQEAIRVLFREAAAAGLIEREPVVDFAP